MQDLRELTTGKEIGYIRLRLPTEGNMCRGWDKAATEVSEVNRTPDFTASIGMLKDRMGEYYIFGNYHANNGEDENIKGRFRKRAGSRSYYKPTSSL